MMLEQGMKHYDMEQERPIRVAQIIGKLSAGGVEAVLFNYYRFIDKRKVQFDFFYDADSTVEPPPYLIDMGARFYRIPPYQHLPAYLKALYAYFRDNRYLIVHSNMNTLAVFSLFAAWRAGVPVRIVHNHSTAGKGETKKNILKYILRPFAGLFATDRCACSRYAGEWMFGKKAVASDKVTILNNAIDCTAFRYDAAARQDMRQQLGVEGHFVVGHVGRFCYQKNHEFLIELFEEIHRQESTAMLLLVGNGELMDAIKAKVHEKGLDDVILFLGVRQDVSQLYQAMDCFVLPSRYEGLGMVGIEAQAAGLPCVFSDEVPREARLTENVHYLSLSAPATAWAAAVLEARNFARKDMLESVRAAGFDIKQEAEKLEQFYHARLNKMAQSYQLFMGRNL